MGSEGRPWLGEGVHVCTLGAFPLWGRVGGCWWSRFPLDSSTLSAPPGLWPSLKSLVPGTCLLL